MNSKKQPSSTQVKSKKAQHSHTAPLSPHIQQHIGNLLKATYGEILSEPVPDRFKEILSKLEEAEKDKKPGSKSGK